jgi:hypothetical protein
MCYVYIYIYIHTYIIRKHQKMGTIWPPTLPIRRFIRGFTLKQDYIHKVPVILHNNLQRESHKPYDPPTSVTWLQLLRKQTMAEIRTLIYAHSLYLWRQHSLVKLTCAWSWRLCGINPATYTFSLMLEIRLINYNRLLAVPTWEGTEEINARRAGLERTIKFIQPRNRYISV